MSSTGQIRIELLAALTELGNLRPEWRLGQTLANLAMTAGRLDPGAVWDLEDDEALAAARTLIAQYSEIETEGARPVASPDPGRPAGSARPDGVAASPGR
jgi:hypothetical protein